MAQREKARRSKGPLDILTEWARVDGGQIEDWHVMEARRLGLSWERIARALGRSRQAVWERWHAHDAELDHDNACAAYSGGRFAYISVPILQYGRGAKPRDPEEKDRRYVLKRLHRLTVSAVHNNTVAARLVKEARTQGATWSHIGAALRISRQAAWKRYGKA
jgi:biotin operon repressor